MQDELPERRAFDVVHHELEGVAVHLDVAHVDHVGVMHARGDTRLGEQGLAVGGILDEVRVRALDGDDLPEAQRAAGGADEDRGHAAGGELHQRLVAGTHGRATRRAAICAPPTISEARGATRARRVTTPTTAAATPIAPVTPSMMLVRTSAARPASTSSVQSP